MGHGCARRLLSPSTMDSPRSQSLAPLRAGGMLSSSPPVADPVETRSTALSPLSLVWLVAPASAPPSPQSSPLPKTPPRKVIADRACVALAGLTLDGRVLTCFLPSEFVKHAFFCDAALPAQAPLRRQGAAC